MRRPLLALALLATLASSVLADETYSGAAPRDAEQSDGFWNWFSRSRDDVDRTTTGSINGDYARGQATCQNGPGISPLENPQCNVFGANGD